MKKITPHLICSALALFVSTSLFAQKRYFDNISNNIKVTNNVSWGTSTDYQGKPFNLNLDMYEINGDTAQKRPVILIAHEGGFTTLSGDKTDNEVVDFAVRMARKGYVVLAFNYRIGWNFGILNTPEQNARQIIPALWRAMQDGKRLVRLVKETAATNRFDPNKIVGAGMGAGAFIFLHTEHIDTPADYALPSVSQKDANGNPTNKSYIDTMAMGGFADKIYSGNTAYSYRTNVVVSMCGAIGDTNFFKIGQNTPIIAVHGDRDNTTPYKSDYVYALGLYQIVPVSGGYDMANVMYRLGPNQIFKDVTNDGCRKTILYSKGLYSFYGKRYQPYDATHSNNTDYTAQPISAQNAALNMDTTVAYVTARIFKVLYESPIITGVAPSVKGAEIQVFPNPAHDVVMIRMSEIDVKGYDVELFNIQGQCVYSQKGIQENNYKLFKGANASGVYTLKLSSAGQTQLRKLIFE